MELKAWCEEMAQHYVLVRQIMTIAIDTVPKASNIIKEGKRADPVPNQCGSLQGLARQ
ncbi:MAG: hypothetical protein IJ242_12340 [Clostridia bacterium]|nr:hypothetical protein [Clostridia bacterium]